jgi:hypothetical protein
LDDPGLSCCIGSGVSSGRSHSRPYWSLRRCRELATGKIQPRSVQGFSSRWTQPAKNTSWWCPIPWDGKLGPFQCQCDPELDPAIGHYLCSNGAP